MMRCERCEGQGLVKVHTDDGLIPLPCSDCGGSGVLDCSEGSQRHGTKVQIPGPILKTHYPTEA